MVIFKKSFGLVLLLLSTTASADVMLGAYVPGDGYSRERIDEINAVSPKPLSFVNIFSSFSHGWDDLYWQTTNIVLEGAMPLVSWMPVDLENPNENILIPISLGLRDDYIDEWGQRLLAWVDQYPETNKPKLLIRFGHEFNGNWYSFGNSPAAFKMAWQHIHNRFQAAGVNQHVEWVWSANNVSVDDYDDITTYYPGAEYVDWTSIDGYNFGTNYSWTDWESFEEVYADTYLTMVNNYPEKPILIAEVGSAEASDLPNAKWGQFGNDTDANENKSDWIANMFVNLEASFPAVRAVAWFNINKELGWSITEQTNTGMAVYIAGVQSDHYTSDFLSTKAGKSDASVPPTELELAALEAARNYELVQEHYATTLSRFNDAKLLLDSAKAKYQRQYQLKLDALAESSSRLELYLSSRTDYLEQHADYLTTSGEFTISRSEMLELRTLYLSDNELMKTVVSNYFAKRDAYLEKRQSFLDQREWLNNAEASLVDAVATYEAAKDLELSDQAIYKTAVDEARNQYTQSFDSFLHARSEFVVMLENFLDVRSELISSSEQRNRSRAGYLQSLDRFTQLRDDFLVALDDRNAALGQLVEHNKVYLTARSNYGEAAEEFTKSANTLASVEENHKSVQLDYQQASVARSNAYQVMVDANHLLSLESNSTSNALMLADASNNGNADKSNNAGTQANMPLDNGKPNVETLASKRKVSVKRVDKAEQRALAQASKPTPMSAEKAAERKQKYANMSSEEKRMLKLSKMSVLNY